LGVDGHLSQQIPAAMDEAALPQRHGTELDLDSLPDLLGEHGLHLPGL
jgi:hypothetical protein